MEFRFSKDSAEINSKALYYLTHNLTNREKGEKQFAAILDRLGNAVERYPSWHPVVTLPKQYLNSSEGATEIYSGKDHTIYFTKGFITCPYHKPTAEELVSRINKVAGLKAEILETSLYRDETTTILVEVETDMLELGSDGKIPNRDAIRWCTEYLVKNMEHAQVAETWWSMRPILLGEPHGSRSSLFVNQHTGTHIKKILEALNNSGVYGPIIEESLAMFSPKKLDSINQTLLQAAIKNYDGKANSFEFHLHNEKCKVNVNDTWEDGTELRFTVEIGNHDLRVSGFYYPKLKKIEPIGDPTGKQEVAKKFI